MLVIVKRSGSMKALFFLLISSVALLCDATANDTVNIDQGASAPFVSVDGEVIGFTLLDQIWVVGRSGGKATPLSPGFGSEGSTRYSPMGGGQFSRNGELVAFRRETVAGRELIVRQLATGDEMVVWPPHRWDSEEVDFSRLSRDIGRVRSFSFMPDSHRLLIQGRGAPVLLDVFNRVYEEFDGIALKDFTLSQDGRIALSNHEWPTFEPKRLPNTIVELSQHERSRISIVDLERKSISNLIKSRDIGYSVIGFSVNQETIFFVEWDGGTERLVEMDLSGQNRRVILEEVLANRQFAIHPDGEALIMSADGGLYEVKLDDGLIVPIPFAAEIKHRPGANERIAIKNVSVFSGTDNSVLEGVAVVVESGKVLSITDNSDYGAIDPALVIDGKGHFLMPGLVDSHSHLAYQSMLRLPDILRAGTTSVINPGSRFPAAMNQKRLVDTGRIAGPHIYVFSDAIDGIGDTVIGSEYVAGVVDEDVGRALVRRFALLGYDGIKLYSALSPALTYAMIDEAKRHSMLTLGHFGATTWEEAVDAGVGAVTHASLFYICRDPFSGAGNKERLWTRPDKVCLEHLFSKMAEGGVTLDPTFVDSTPLLWPKQKFERYKDYYPERDYVFEYQVLVNVILMAHKAGVSIIIGRDDWDWSLIREMEAYERIGIPRAEVLRMATVNAAKFLQMEDEFGTVEPGMRADLILVDGNPLQRIGDIRNLQLVMKEGEIVVNRLGAEAVTSTPPMAH